MSGGDIWPCWIVINMSAPEPRNPIRHGTFADALQAADNLARHYPGDRFSVFAFTGTSKQVERSEPCAT